jgi:hypothetical protein
MQMTLCYWLRNGATGVMNDRLMESGRFYGIEINVRKNYGYKNLKATVPSKEYDRSKTAGECVIFQLFGQHDNK